MSKECKDYCSNHSGCIKEIEFSTKKISDLELKLERLQGNIEGRFTSVNNDIKDINEKLREEMKAMNDKLRSDMKEMNDEVKNEIKSLSDIIAKKDEANGNTKENRFNTYLSSGILPSIILILGFLIEKYLK